MKIEIDLNKCPTCSRDTPIDVWFAHQRADQDDSKKPKENLHEEIVIGTWGIGPAYRDRIKKSIRQAIDSKYEKLMKYIILTDMVDDFSDVDADIKDLIVGVYDIHELRKNDLFSLEKELLPPVTKDDEEFALGYMKNEGRDDVMGYASSELRFSYNLKRYILKAAALTNYTKILSIDPDITIPYKEIVDGNLNEDVFWSIHDTKENTIRGFGYERIRIQRKNEHLISDLIYHDYMKNALGYREFIFYSSHSYGLDNGTLMLQAASIVMSEYSKNHTEEKHSILINSLEILEGNVRLYNFDTTERLNDFFNSLNEITELCLKNNEIYYNMRCGGYILCDYLPLAITCYLYKNILTIFNLPTEFTFRTNQFHIDRYWGPPYIEVPPCEGCKPLSFLPEMSRKKFLENENNKKIISILKEKNFPM